MYRYTVDGVRNCCADTCVVLSGTRVPRPRPSSPLSFCVIRRVIHSYKIQSPTIPSCYFIFFLRSLKELYPSSLSHRKRVSGPSSLSHSVSSECTVSVPCTFLGPVSSSRPDDLLATRDSSLSSLFRPLFESLQNPS